MGETAFLVKGLTNKISILYFGWLVLSFVGVGVSYAINNSSRKDVRIPLLLGTLTSRSHPTSFPRHRNLPSFGAPVTSPQFSSFPPYGNAGRGTSVPTNGTVHSAMRRAATVRNLPRKGMGSILCRTFLGSSTEYPNEI